MALYAFHKFNYNLKVVIVAITFSLRHALCSFQTVLDKFYYHTQFAFLSSVYCLK